MASRTHYRDFYGFRADAATAGRDRPVAIVHGNCQAEAVRVLLSSSPTFAWRTVRVPPVHELTEDDLAPYDRLLGAATLLLSQPVRDGYRGLPLGTAEVAGRMAAGAQVVRWPVVRDAGVHPWQAIVRAGDGAEPPVVPYHDLRTLTGRTPNAPDLVAAAGHSRGELARRERRDCDVAVSDLLPGLGAQAVHTINHPTNPLLIALAGRLQDALHQPVDVADPGRELLGGTRAPLEAEVLTALGLDAAAARPYWLVGEQVLSAQAVSRAQRAWYATRPDVVAAGVTRYAERLPLLGLG